MSGRILAYLFTGSVIFSVLTGSEVSLGSEGLNSGGLRFASKDVYSSQRTSLRLFNAAKPVTKSFDLKFICSIYNSRQFGFVFRALQDAGNSHIPLIHLLYIPSMGNSDSSTFEFHISSSTRAITFAIDTLHLQDIEFEIGASLDNKVFSIRCNGERKEIPFEFPKEPELNFIFGLYGENADVAPMIIQNIHLSLNGQADYYWPLNEISGNTAHEKINHARSDVINPAWLQDQHYYWERLISIRTDPMAGIVYDKKNRIILLNKDSLVIYSPRDGALVSQKYGTPRPFDRNAFFAVLNPKTGKIIAYDFHFLKVNDGRKTYSVFDLRDYTWSGYDTTGAVDQNHHHCAFWNRDTSKLVVFGGYSYYHYYNTFKLFDFNSGLWEEMRFSGDTIYPRTHASVGRNGFNGKYFLYGGFGNREGLQHLEGRYFYDLYEISPENRMIRRIWDIRPPGFEFVPRGNLVFRPDSPLCYVLGNRPVENSFLRLYEISLTQPRISIVSDSIPVVFSDMAGNAFLYENVRDHELYCVTRETRNEPTALTTVYRLKFPPVSLPVWVADQERFRGLKYLLALIPLLFLGLFWYILRFRRHKIRSFVEKFKEPGKFERRNRNAVWLLKEFRVFDSDGRDITYRFAKKVRHAFMVLFFENHYNNGISTSEFSGILWPNLTKEQQKNNRGVLINSMRKLFEDLPGLGLDKDNSHWHLTFGPEVFIDFIEVQKALASGNVENDNEAVRDFLSLGNLLQDEDWEYLDPYKEKYGSTAVETLLGDCKNAFFKKNYLLTIEISDMILSQFDFLNETALIYKIKALCILKNTTKAIAEFNKFRLRYNESMAKSFHLTFESILNIPVPVELADL